MLLVLITAIGVGGATVIGALIGFMFRNISQNTTMPYWICSRSYAGGCGNRLIIPSAEMTGRSGIWMTVLGIFFGAIFLNFMDKLTPHLHNLSGIDVEKHAHNESLDKVLLFVFAIAIHNFPEGLAAGVGFGSEDIGNALMVAIGIALQNIPEAW